MAAFLSLFKLRIVALLVLLAAATATVAAQGKPQPDAVALLVAAGVLACAGASALNNYLDRDIDAAMRRTRRRALPQKTLPPALVLFLGCGMTLAAALLALRLNSATAGFVSAGAFIYVVIYTALLKRRTPLNIVVGGLAGSCAVLAGWTAVDAGLSLTAGLLAALLFLWTPAHFWAFAMVHRGDYLRAGIPMLPVIYSQRITAGWILAHTIALALIGIAIGFSGGLGLLYFGAALLGGTLFAASALRLLKQPGSSHAWQHYKGSGLYLLLLFVALALDSLVAGG